MRVLTILTAACVGAAWLGTRPAFAQPGYSGEGDFQVFCTSCHGATAKGDGPIAKSLVKRPPDLTRLSARNNAVYPQDQVFKSIDGRGAHNNPDMPAWNEVFAKAQESTGPEAAKARIMALVEYLKSIQEKH